MGESQLTLFQPKFNRSIRVEARADRLSGDAGALPLRDLADRLGYRTLLADVLADRRDPERTRHPFGELLLTDLLLRAQGWTDHSDATLLRHAPLLRLAVSERRGEALGRALFTLTKRRLGLVEGRWRAEAIVDMDSLPIEVHGHQPGTAYNGHYRLRCYHPLVARRAGPRGTAAPGSTSSPTRPAPGALLVGSSSWSSSGPAIRESCLSTTSSS